MFCAKVTDPSLGTLRLRWGKWRGRVDLIGTGSEVEVVIEPPQDARLQPFLDRVGRVVTNFAQLQPDFAGQLYDDYHLYKRMAIEAGGLTEEDFKAFPAVPEPAEVWSALKPYRLWHGGLIDRYCGNAYLLVDVD